MMDFLSISRLREIRNYGGFAVTRKQVTVVNYKTQVLSGLGFKYEFLKVASKVANAEYVEHFIQSVYQFLKSAGDKDYVI